MSGEPVRGGGDPSSGAPAPERPAPSGPMDPFVALDATAQAALVRRREVAPIELVDAAIARVEALDGPLNAIIAPLFEQARAQARRKRHTIGPFEGVPFLVKDLSSLGGAPLTFGSKLFARHKVRRSEPSVEASLDAGLIAIGKSNTPEFGLIGVTEPLLYGPTRNPWALDRSPGGSSGGAAAAVAAGLTPIADAGDGGGSIRIPASCCGLVGLKPSRDRAILPKAETPGDLSVHLAVSRSVRDTAQMLAIKERGVLAAGLEPIGLVEGPSRRRLRIAVSSVSNNGRPPEPEVARALEEVAALCEDLGHTVEWDEPHFDREAAIERFLVYWSAIPAKIERMLFMLRIIAWNWEPIEEALEPWTRSLAEWHRRRLVIEDDPMEKSLAFFDDVARRYAAFFQKYDLILTPVLRGPPAMIGEYDTKMPFDALLEKLVDYIAYTPIFNAIGAPAISLPLSETSDGLPIGAHFGAAVGAERRLLELAYELEAARPWADRWPAYSAMRPI